MCSGLFTFSERAGTVEIGQELVGRDSNSKPYALLPPSSGFHDCIGLANTCRNIQEPAAMT